MRAVITVVGKDMVGILAKVATYCSDRKVNVEDVTQSVLKDLFAMIMLVDAKNLNTSFTEFSKGLEDMGDEMGLSIHAMHEDIFNSMHRV